MLKCWLQLATDRPSQHNNNCRQCTIIIIVPHISVMKQLSCILLTKQESHTVNTTKKVQHKTRYM